MDKGQSSRQYTNLVVTRHKLLGLLADGKSTLIIMVRPERFELPTSWFVARRSIQLSYGRTLTKTGGERGIRTLDGLLTHTPLAGARLRPLGHLSGARYLPLIAQLSLVYNHQLLLGFSLSSQPPAQYRSLLSRCHRYMAGATQEGGKDTCRYRISKDLMQ